MIKIGDTVRIKPRDICERVNYSCVYHVNMDSKKGKKFVVEYINKEIIDGEVCYITYYDYYHWDLRWLEKVKSKGVIL